MKKFPPLFIFLLVFLSSIAPQKVLAQTTIDFDPAPDVAGAIKKISVEGFTFNSNLTNSYNIGFLSVGFNGTKALIDGNNDTGGLTKWTISKDAAGGFQFREIWIFNRDPGGLNTSTSGNIQGFKNGLPTGSAKTINFSGFQSFVSDSDFFDVDSIQIVAPDIYVAIDNFTYGPVFVPVDTDPSEVTSIFLTGTPLSNVPSVSFTVNFSKTAFNVSADDFILTKTGSANGTIASITGSGATYSLTVNSITGEGSIRLDLKSGTNITNANGNTGTPAFTSGQSHFVSPCLIETFENETAGSKSFSTGTNNFSITGNLEVYTQTLTVGIGGSKFVLKNTGTGTYTINSSSGTVLLNTIAFYLSSFADGNTPTGTGSLTLVGKRAGSTVYTITKTSGFNVTPTANSGYTILDFATEGGVNNATKPIDQLEITTGGAFVYLNVDNFQFCNDKEAPSGYTATIDQNLIDNGNQNAVSFTFAGAEIGATYNYTFSSSGGGTNVTGSGNVGSSTQQVSGIDLTGLGEGTITLSVTLTDASSNTGIPATDTSTKLLNTAPVATAPSAPVVNEDDVAVALSDDFEVSDGESDAQTLTFTITGGTLNLGTAGITFGGSGNGSAAFTASGTLAAINTALDAATFTPTPNLFGATAGQISFISNDGTVDSNTASVIFAIAGVNDDPTFTGLPASITVVEDVIPSYLSNALSDGTFADVDAGANPVSLILTLNQGTFGLAATGGIPVNLAGNGTSTVTISGAVADVEAYVSTNTNIAFIPPLNSNGVGAATLTVSANDGGNTGTGGGSTVELGQIQIDITSVNDTPTDILLDNASVEENQPVGTLVGAFSATDPDTGDTFTFTLVAGVGSEDNGSFSISGNELQTAAVFDFSTKNSYSIRIRVTDSSNLTFEKSFTIAVEEFNEVPTDFSLDNNSLAENQVIGTTVGSFSADDPNPGDNFTYSFAPGVGDADNGSFSIVGDELQTAAVFDFETKNTYSVRVRVTDAGGLFLELPFSVNVTDVNEFPVVLTQIPNQNATEDAAFSFQFALNTFQDGDGDVLGYSAQLSGGGALPAWLSFNSTNRTFSGTPLNAHVGTVTIDVIANDGNGGTVTDTFDIVVANANDAPTVANAISNQNATEDQLFNFQFADNTFADIDVGDALTYTGQLAGGGALPLWLSFDPLTRTFSGIPSNENVGTLSIDVIANDGDGGTVTDTFDIVVANVNDAPTVANAISNQNATEDAAFNFQFATNTFNDIDVGDVLTYTAQLAGGGSLPLWLSFDAATQTFSGTPLNAHVGTVSIDVIANDGNGGTVTDTFDIVVANANDAPTVANVISDQNATEDQLFNFQFAENTFNDIDIGDVLTYSAQLSGGAALPAWLDFEPTTRIFSGTPGNDDTGVIEIEVTATDNSAAGVSTTFGLNVAGINDAPEVSAPLSVAVFEDDAEALTAISLTDPDAGSSLVEVTFTVASGSLSAVSAGGVTVSGTSSALVLEGSISDINDFISAGSLTFTTALNSTSDVILNINISDNGNTGTGGALTDQASVTIDVTAVNDAPVNTVPGIQQTDQDVSLVFSGGNGNLISISDVDAGGAIVKVSLTVTNGQLSLSGNTGLAFTTGSGVNNSSMVFDGTVADINSALSGMVFTPTPGYNGSAYLTITTDDQGFSGSGSALTDTDEITINVNSLNPVVTSVTSSSANGLYNEGDEISIQVIFDQPVEVNTAGEDPTLVLETGIVDRAASYVDGSGTTVLNFSYTVQEGDASDDLDYASINSLILNGAVIENSTDDPAILELPAVGSANSLSGQKNLIIDGVIPVIASVSVPADGVYAIGQNLDFTVNFSEAVVVTGTPQISLTIGATTRQASYLSGSGTSALVLRYTVQSGDLDLNGIVAGTLSLNEATVRDAAGNNANLMLNGIGSTSQVLVDGVRPTVVSLSLDNTSLNIGQSATLSVVFSERVSGLEVDDFTVANGALNNLTSSDGGLSWTAVFNPSSGVQDDTNSLILSNSGVTDLAGNAGTGTTESENYEIDTQLPTVMIVVADTELTVGETSLVTISFTEEVSGLSLDDFTVGNGVLSDLESGDGGTTWTATLTPDTGVEDDTNLITLDNTGFEDSAENTGTGTSNSNNYLVDTAIPTGYSVTIVPALINGVNETDFSFNLTDGEIGSDYSYTISSDGGGAPITGNGSVSSSNQLIEGIDVSSLPDGELTLTVTLIDPVGNEGDEMSDIVDKLLPAKLTITVAEDAEELGVDGRFVVETDNLFAANTTITLEIGGTATPGSDYTPIGVDLFFPGNTSTVSIPVSVIDDLDVEGDETVSIRLVSTDNTLVTIGEPDEATLTIADNDAPRQLIITPAPNQQKVYGSTDPVTFTYTASGFDPGDDESIIQGAIGRATGEDADTYSFTLGNLDAGPNYELVLDPEVFTIIPASLTITAGDKSKVYGAVNPALTFTYSGLVNGDTQVATEPSISITATQGSDVGTYPITLSGGSDPNYAITPVNGTLTITPASLTITADDKQKIFGAVNPALTFTYDGLVNGDTQLQTVPTLETTATETSPVGGYPITVIGGSDPNYAISRVNGTLTIGQKTVTITASNESKIYGQANPVLTFSYTGLLEGDTQIQSEPTISTEATISSPVGTYEITLSGGSDPNYAFTLVNGTLSVTPASLTITADDKSKVYGEANPTLTFTYDGLVNGDTQVATEPSISTTAAQGSSVGTYPITLSGGSDPNYAITLVNGTLTVGQKALTITADDKQKIYGEANPALTFTYSGLVNGDTQVATEPSISTTATQGADVGTYPITLSGGSDPNYAITLVNGTLTITPASLTLTADDKSKVYGAANPPLTFSYAGLVNGDTGVAVEPSLATTATASSPVGTYEITLSGGSDPNYAISRINGTLTIGQKTVTITAADQSKVYGQANPVLTFSYTDLLEGDTQIQTEPSISTEATISSPVGTYEITLSGGSDPNYAFTLVNGTLSVTPASLTITADDKSKVYGEANPALTFSYAGLVNGDTQIATEPGIASAATASSNAGTYPITLSGGSDPNYAITLVNGTLTVGQKALTITADDKQKIYGEANPVLTFSYAGLVNGDTQIATEPGIATAATASSNVGTYPITLSGGSDPNYAITLVNGILTVGQKDLTITADDKQKIYGEANPPLTFSYTGLVNGDTQIAAEPSITTTATASSNVGTYPISLSGGSDPNYAITIVNGTLSVTQANLTITAEYQTKLYGDADPMLTYLVHGLKSGDTEAVITGVLSRAAGEDVGVYAIQQGSIDAGANYMINYNPADFEITPRTLNIIANSNQSKIYGSDDPVFEYGVSNFGNGDNTSVLTGTLSRDAGENVGTYSITLGTLNAGGNYVINFTGADFTIAEKVLNITADEGQGKVFGTADPVLTYIVTGYGYSDDASILSGNLNRAAGENVGTYPISLGTLDAGSNYAINFTGADFSITKADIPGITFEDASFVYDGTAKSLAIGGTLPAGTSVSYADNSRTDVGTQEVTATITGSNFTTLVLTADLTVTPAVVTGITFADANFVYDGTAKSLSIGGTLPVGTSVSYADNSRTNVGTQEVTATISGSNFTTLVLTADLTVTPADVTGITFADASFVYNGTAKSLAIGGTLPAGTSVSYADNSRTDVGTQEVTANITGGNYQELTLTAQLSISPRQLQVVTTPGQSKVAGAADPAFAYTATGFVAGDGVELMSGMLTRAPGEEVGVYDISLGALSAGDNYTISFTGADFEIISGDSDGDGVPDAVETEDGTDPTDPNDYKDSDGDDVPDYVEENEGTDSDNPRDYSDEDGDQVPDYVEERDGTDPSDPTDFVDENGDGIADYIGERSVVGGIPQSVQVAWGTLESNLALSAEAVVITGLGELVNVPVVWNLAGYNPLVSGVVAYPGEITLPAGLLNPQGIQAELQIEVLPKAAPQDIELSEDEFTPLAGQSTQLIGTFSTVDPVDDIHSYQLVNASGNDGQFFSIQDNMLYWSTQEALPGRTSFTIQVSSTDRAGNVIEKSFVITRTRIPVDEIEIFNSFTPNGDGINDTWGVPDLQYFQGGRVQVFDRSGQRIFYTESPSERWDGTFEGREMPVGSYYWILESRETGEVRRGVLTLLRD